MDGEFTNKMDIIHLDYFVYLHSDKRLEIINMPATMVYFSDFNLISKKKCNFDIIFQPDFHLNEGISQKIGHSLKLVPNT